MSTYLEIVIYGLFFLACVVLYAIDVCERKKDWVDFVFNSLILFIFGVLFISSILTRC